MPKAREQVIENRNRNIESYFHVLFCFGLATAGLLLVPGRFVKAEDATAEGEVAETRKSTGTFDYANLSIEELMNLQVTSVAGTAQDWFGTPSALYVITAEDIRRSGHQLLPEVLRLVPGATVAQIDARNWQISFRGFEGLFANKLLVLMDGRQIYNPSFAGVMWDNHDLILADVDRIEAIRGPGATLWGANAVNGVINITTKSAKDTQGWYLSELVGSPLNNISQARYGGQIDDSTWFRVWSKYLDHDNFETSAGDDFPDDWDSFHGGFRIDHEGADGVNLMIDSAVFHSDRLGESILVTVPGPPPAGGGFAPREDDARNTAAHLLARWYEEEETRGWSFQTYFDWIDLRRLGDIGYEQHSFDVDWRQHFQWGEADEHELVWGLRYRVDVDDFDDGVDISFRPTQFDHHREETFVQDTWEFVKDKWFLMLGSKFEYNTHTHFEVQPGARLWWTPDDKQTIWTSVSRSVRTPTRGEEDIINTLAQIDLSGFGGGITRVNIFGNDGLDSEEQISFETGYRRRLGEDVTVDVSGFWNEYNDMSSRAPVPAPGSKSTNFTDATTFGGEVMATWHPRKDFHVESSYSYISVDVGIPTATVHEGTPEHQTQLRTTYDVTDDLEWNTATYYVAQRPGMGIGSYTRLDTGLTWRPRENLEVALWGVNLLEPNHLEGMDSLGPAPVEVPRSVYAQVTLRY